MACHIPIRQTEQTIFPQAIVSETCNQSVHHFASRQQEVTDTEIEMKSSSTGLCI